MPDPTPTTAIKFDLTIGEDDVSPRIQEIKDTAGRVETTITPPPASAAGGYGSYGGAGGSVGTGGYEQPPLPPYGDATGGGSGPGSGQPILPPRGTVFGSPADYPAPYTPPPFQGPFGADLAQTLTTPGNQYEGNQYAATELRMRADDAAKRLALSQKSDEASQRIQEQRAEDAANLTRMMDRKIERVPEADRPYFAQQVGQRVAATGESYQEAFGAVQYQYSQDTREAATIFSTDASEKRSRINDYAEDFARQDRVRAGEDREFSQYVSAKRSYDYATAETPFTQYKQLGQYAEEAGGEGTPEGLRLLTQQARLRPQLERLSVATVGSSGGETAEERIAAWRQSRGIGEEEAGVGGFGGGGGAGAPTAANPASWLVRRIDRIGFYIAADLALRTVKNTTDAELTYNQDIRLAGSDTAQQLAALQGFNQKTNTWGALGSAGADSIQNAIYGRDVSATGTELIARSSNAQEMRIATMNSSAQFGYNLNNQYDVTRAGLYGGSTAQEIAEAHARGEERTRDIDKDRRDVLDAERAKQLAYATQQEDSNEQKARTSLASNARHRRGLFGVIEGMIVQNTPADLLFPNRGTNINAMADEGMRSFTANMDAMRYSGERAQSQGITDFEISIAQRDQRAEFIRSDAGYQSNTLLAQGQPYSAQLAQLRGERDSAVAKAATPESVWMNDPAAVQDYLKRAGVTENKNGDFVVPVAGGRSVTISHLGDKPAWISQSMSGRSPGGLGHLFDNLSIGDSFPELAGNFGSDPTNEIQQRAQRDGDAAIAAFIAQTSREMDRVTASIVGQTQGARSFLGGDPLQGQLQGLRSNLDYALKAPELNDPAFAAQNAPRIAALKAQEDTAETQTYQDYTFQTYNATQSQETAEATARLQSERKPFSAAAQQIQRDAEQRATDTIYAGGGNAKNIAASILQEAQFKETGLQNEITFGGSARYVENGTLGPGFADITSRETQASAVGAINDAKGNLGNFDPNASANALRDAAKNLKNLFNPTANPFTGASTLFGY